MPATRRKAEPADTATAETWTPAIKGFDKHLRCRGFQFEVGGEYRHEGEVGVCASGFHVITGHPLAVFGYYHPADGSRFCHVDIGGKTDSDDGTKSAAEILCVGQETSLSGLVQEAVRWVMARATSQEGETATGDMGAASATGYMGAASATGDKGAASATGHMGAASATGDMGAASATGDRSIAHADGTACRALAADGCGLTIAERDHDGNLLHLRAFIAGRDGIKPDTWYMLRDGELVEVEEA